MVNNVSMLRVVVAFALAGCWMAVPAGAGEMTRPTPPRPSGPTARTGGGAQPAAPVRLAANEELAACFAVLRTLRMGVQARSLPTLQQALAPGLWMSMTREAGPGFGGAEFFAALAQELRERQPDPDRDFLMPGLAQGRRVVLVFIKPPPAPLPEESGDAALAGPAWTPYKAEAESEPIRTAWVVFEQAPAGAWLLAGARFEEREADFLRGARMRAELAELYHWANFLGNPLEAPAPYGPAAADAGVANPRPHPNPNNRPAAP